METLIVKKYLPAISLLGIITTLTLQPKHILALEPTQIYTKAKQFTVQIDGEETGTGTIIQRDNDTYTVLTCWHVMDTPGNYQITTSDGTTHQVTKVESLTDIDLAIITFSSSNTYPVAEIGDSTLATSGLDAYVVGYPDPFPGVPERQYFTYSAEVQSRLTEGENGYQIIHDGSFTPGSSGGGIFDSEARLIGVNGQFISEGNTGKVYGAGIPVEIYQTATGNFATPTNVLPPQDFVSIGKRKLQQEDYNGAIEEFDRALASNPNDLEALSNRGEAYYLLEDFNAAINDFDAVLAQDANNPIFLFQRGNSYQKLEKYQNAIADYNKAIGLNSQFTTAYNNRGLVYESLEQYDKAITDYNQAISLNPQFVYAYNNRGITYYELEEYQNAISDYNKAISLNPQYAEAYSNRGLVYGELKQYDKAIADHDRAISVNPQYVNAYNNRGLVYESLEQYDKAITDYTQAIDLNAEYGEAYYNRGIVYDNLKLNEQAIADYTKAVRLKPELWQAYYKRGNSYHKLDKYEQAIADYTEAINLNTQIENVQVAEVYMKRGNSYSQLGRYEQAIADCMEAVRMNPQLTGAYLVLGISHDHLGNNTEAIESYQQAANLLQQEGDIELYKFTTERIRELQ